MTPQERADFLAWLSRLDLGQLHEIQGHVAGVITFKRGARLRALMPGSRIVFDGRGAKKDSEKLEGTLVGTVVRLFKTSIEVENIAGQRCRVEADAVLGFHVGGMEYTPLESAAPLGFVQTVDNIARYPSGEIPVIEGPALSEDLHYEVHPEDFHPDVDWEPPSA
jgi:hypothetical protein